MLKSSPLKRPTFFTKFDTAMEVTDVKSNLRFIIYCLYQAILEAGLLFVIHKRAMAMTVIVQIDLSHTKRMIHYILPIQFH